MSKPIDDLLLLVARILIAALFFGGAVQKSFSPQDAADLLVQWGLPAAVVYLALLYNAVAGFAILLGWQVRNVALSLAGYCAVTSVFHWIPSDPWQMSIFVKNWAIAGGCLALAVAGSGRIALRPDRSIG